MTITPVNVTGAVIEGADGLSPIHVFWIDLEPGRGYATIICFGSAWTVYFGAMAGQTIRQFFAQADTGYLVIKMGITPQLKQTKRDHIYLGKIIDAVKGSLAITAARPQCPEAISPAVPEEETL